MSNLNFDALNELKRTDSPGAPPTVPPSAPAESFSALSFIVAVNKFLGWASLIVIPIGMGIAGPRNSPFVAGLIIGLVPGFLGWLVFMATAQSLRLFMAMEEHLRAIRDSLRR